MSLAETNSGLVDRCLMPGDVKLCNCARCDKELLGASMPEGLLLPTEFRQHEHVHARIAIGVLDCPCCRSCYLVMNQEMYVQT